MGLGQKGKVVESRGALWHRVKVTQIPSKPQNYLDWYAKVFPALTGHGLWLRGDELNTLSADEFEKRHFRVIFARLSTYFDTADSFTQAYLYQLAADLPGVFPDLSYLPPRNDLRIFEADGIPWLLGAGTKRGACSFDWLGISNSIVQELINLPSLLVKSGIPLSKKERLARADLPLVVLGGANALYSTALWTSDPWVDGIFVGESDQAIRKLLEISRDAKASGAGKAELLHELEKVDGFLQPDQPRKIRKAIISKLDESIPHTRGPVPFVEETLGGGALQISEGCPCFCTFCAESWDRKPYRERSGSSVVETALAAKAHRGLDSADLYSFNFNMHSDFYSILWDLVPSFRSIGLKSQRFDLLAHDPVMAEVQHAVEKASFTCGLEGISPRLRKYLQKNLSDADLRRSLASIFQSKCREIKVFLIATGLEQNEDFEAFSELLRTLKSLKQAAHSGARVIFSMTPLVRFPWTPLEFEDAPVEGVYVRVIRQVMGRVQSSGFEFREAADLPEYWVSQVLVRAKDEKISEALLSAVQKSDFLYYRSVSPAFRKLFENELTISGLSTTGLLRGISPTAQESEAPWTWIETGVLRSFLRESWEQSRRFEESAYCLGRSWVKASCLHCGGCPTRFHVRDIVLAKQERAYSLDQFKERVKQQRLKEIELTFAVTAGIRSRGVSRRMLGVALARALMLEDPQLARDCRGFSGSYWGEDLDEVWLEGEEFLRLRWNGAYNGVNALQNILADPARRARIQERLGDWGQLISLVDQEACRREGKRILLTAKAQPCVESYLRKQDLKHTLRKSGNRAIYEFIPAALKKGLFRSLEVKTEADFTEIQAITGPKLTGVEIQSFCKNAFVLRNSEDWIRSRCKITQGQIS